MRDFVLSDEVRIRKAISTANASAANRVPVIVENIKTQEKREYSSMTEASEALGVHKTNIGKAINKKSVVKKSYICYLHTKERD